MSYVEIGDRIRVTAEGTYNGGEPIEVGTFTGGQRDWEYETDESDTLTVEVIQKKKIESRDGLSLGDRIKHRLGGEGVIVEFHDFGTNGGGDMKVAWETGATAGRTVGTLQQNVEKIEPEPKFKVGDRVRFVKDLSPMVVGDIGTVRGVFLPKRMAHVLVPGKTGHCNPDGWNVYFDEIEPAPDQTFKLKPGDKIRNTKTGREGVVVHAANKSHPWPECRVDYVIDTKLGDTRAGRSRPRVPVAAIEEYEEHHPGTYEVIEREGQPF